MVLPKHVGIIYSDVKREYFPTEAQYLTEKDAERDAKLIATYLKNLGIAATLYPADELLPENLRKKNHCLVHTRFSNGYHQQSPRSFAIHTFTL